MSNSFLFRKTLLEPLGTTIYEFPYHYASRAWPTILEERNDPYEIATIEIAVPTSNASANKKAHIARIVELFDDVLKQVGTANVRSESLVSVRVLKSSSVNSAASSGGGGGGARSSNAQPMQLLVQPRSFEFNTHVGMSEISKILLSHDPLMLDCVVVIDRRIQKGPVPMREIRNAYRAALLEFVESERVRLNASDSLRSTDLRSAVVSVQLLARGGAPPASFTATSPPSHLLSSPLPAPIGGAPPPLSAHSSGWPQQQFQQQQHLQQTQQTQYDDGVALPAFTHEHAASSAAAGGGLSYSTQSLPGIYQPAAAPKGAASSSIYPMTSPTSPMYSPQKIMQQQQQQGCGVPTGGTMIPLQQNHYQQQAADARRKDQPPAPLLPTGISQTSMYFETGQYGPATTQSQNAALPPDFFASA